MPDHTDEQIAQTYIDSLCKMLEIDPPTLSFDTSHFSTDTMMAQIELEDRILYIKNTKRNADYMFSIAHELRHLWQWDTDKEHYFGNYKTADQLGKEEYNMQIAEIDAHAFAGVIMEDIFALTPLYQGLSDKVVDEIKKRMLMI